MSSPTCPECNQGCNSKHFQNDFNNWTSGNDKIDKFIQEALLNANHNWELIEWIPYDRFKDVKQVGRGGFVGELDQLRNEMLKINNGKDIKKMKIHLKTWTEKYAPSIQFYGITQDPETHSYMMVLQYATDGNI
ncbi:hypothetical protein Glove_54g42 [Diversispora epigaea]|uniref:Uncharacterized protein n=1 Tax=Diversispora epigaea TaxID=1348612 RepID=A0A397JCL5_9GLOM|nr:hypothetical protein Glove_54g42 [Diversispora epigaea]